MVITDNSATYTCPALPVRDILAVVLSVRYSLSPVIESHRLSKVIGHQEVIGGILIEDHAKQNHSVSSHCVFLSHRDQPVRLQAGEREAEPGSG